jgi:Ca2+/H+ antiporter, TMEM165/GDT1 family
LAFLVTAANVTEVTVGLKVRDWFMDWQTVGIAFGLILFMEMGDKTQLAVLTLVTRTGHVAAVSLGAAAGLTAVAALGVTVGAAATELVHHSWLALGAGMLFVLLGLLTLWSAVKGEGDDQEEIRGARFWRLVATGRPWVVSGGSFGLLLLAEMGDKSQLAVIGLVGQTGQPGEVFLGATAALVLLTLVAAVVGRVAVRLIPVRWVSAFAGALFLLVGGLTLARAFYEAIPKFVI